MKKILSTLAAFGVLLGSVLPVAAATSQNAAHSEWLARPDVIALSLQVRTNVATTNHILLRVSIKNASRELYRIIYTLPWYMVDMTVKDDHGEIISPVTSPRGGRIWFENHLDLKPGESQILKGPDRSDWLDLADWGYRLTRPGRYSIEAAPTVHGFQPSGARMTNKFDSKGSPHSQPVVVEVTQ